MPSQKLEIERQINYIGLQRAEKAIQSNSNLHLLYEELAKELSGKSKLELIEYIQGLYKRSITKAEILGEFLLEHCELNTKAYLQCAKASGNVARVFDAAYPLSLHIDYESLLDNRKAQYVEFIDNVTTDFVQLNGSDKTSFSAWLSNKVRQLELKSSDEKNKVEHYQSKINYAAKNEPTKSELEKSVDFLIDDFQSAKKYACEELTKISDLLTDGKVSSWSLDFQFQYSLFRPHRNGSCDLYYDMSTFKKLLMDAPSKINKELALKALATIEVYEDVYENYRKLKSILAEYNDTLAFPYSDIEHKGVALTSDQLLARDGKIVALAKESKFEVYHAFPIQRIIQNALPEMESYVEKYAKSSDTYEIRKHGVAVDFVKLLENINKEINRYPNVNPNVLIQFSRQFADLQKELKDATDKANERCSAFFVTHRGGKIYKQMFGKGPIGSLPKKLDEMAQLLAQNAGLLRRSESGLGLRPSLMRVRTVDLRFDEKQEKSALSFKK